MTSQYGINIKAEVEKTSIKQAYDSFKQLEKAVQGTRSQLELLKKQNEELKRNQNALTAAYYGFTKGAGATVNVLRALAAVFFDNKKAITANNKALKEAKQAASAQRAAKKQLIQDVVNEAKAFSESSNTVMKGSRALKEYIVQLQHFRDQISSSTTGKRNIITDAITKADFTRQIKQLNDFTQAANRTAFALSAMAEETTAMEFGGGRTSKQSLQGLLNRSPDEFHTDTALSNYIRTLERTAAVLNRNEKEYAQVNKKIQEMNRLMREGQQVAIASQTGFSPDQYGPRLPLAGERAFARMTAGNRQFQPGGLFFEQGGFAARRKNALSSALIGGGFPLLFGQGLGASVGGGIGGAAGGLLGGGLGFGLSLVGTQLGKQVDTLIIKAKDLGQSLSDLYPDMEALTEASGLANTAAQARLQIIEQLEGKEAAITEARRRMNIVIGEKGVNSLKDFGDMVTKLTNSMTIFFTKLAAGTASIINFAARLLGIAQEADNRSNRELVSVSKGPVADRINTLWEEMEAMSGRSRDTGYGYSGIGPLPDSVKKIERREALEELDRMYATQVKAAAIADQITLKSQLELKTLKEQAAIKQKTIELTAKYGEELAAEVAQVEALFDEEGKRLELKVEEAKKAAEMKDASVETIVTYQKLNDKLKEHNELKGKAVDLTIDLNDESDILKDVYEDIGGIIKDGITDAIYEAIKGTKTLGEVASRVLDQIAKKIIESQVDKMFSSFSGGGGAGAVAGAKEQKSSWWSQIPLLGLFAGKRAAGGPVTGGSSYLVGEKGPELFVPGSSGNIVPNNAMGGMVINVDASGSSVEGDADKSRELGQLIGAAVQAEIGRQKRPGGMLY